MTFISNPIYVGGYRIGNPPSTIQFNFTVKPKLIHRFFMKLCLGWEWIDDKSLKEK